MPSNFWTLPRLTPYDPLRSRTTRAVRHGEIRRRLRWWLGAVALLAGCGQGLAEGQPSASPIPEPYANRQEEMNPADPGAVASDEAYGENQPAHPALGPGQLEQLVAPIALYPDRLVAEVLAASTYPQQVSEAYRWRQEQANASPDQIVSGADAANWDPSVKSLTAFPEVLAQMAANLDWTADLGNAYFNQPEDVLEAVQVMRRRAQAAGTLRTTAQEIVRQDAGEIELAPADPEFVYVPTYNPWAAYGEPVSPYPGFSLLGTVGNFLGSAVLRYGFGVALSAFAHTPWGWLAWGLDWLAHSLMFHQSAYSSHSLSVAHWGLPHHGFYAYPAHGGFNRMRQENARAWGNESWRSKGANPSGWRPLHREPDRRPEAGREDWGWHSARGFASFRRDDGFRAGGNGFHRLPGAMAEQREPFRSASNRRNSSAMPRAENIGRGDSIRAGGGDMRGAWGVSPYRGSEGRGNEFRTGQLRQGTSEAFGRSAKEWHAGGAHRFSEGHTEKSFRSRSGSSGSHASKGFGGSKGFGSKGFGGGHSHGGGGHSAGHGGGKHHR
jgi:Protein of unknown function (DUF3300)